MRMVEPPETLSGLPLSGTQRNVSASLIFADGCAGASYWPGQLLLTGLEASTQANTALSVKHWAEKKDAFLAIRFVARLLQ